MLANAAITIFPLIIKANQNVQHFQQVIGDSINRNSIFKKVFNLPIADTIGSKWVKNQAKLKALITKKISIIIMFIIIIDICFNRGVCNYLIFCCLLVMYFFTNTKAV